MAELDRDKVVATLNRLLEIELAGVVRYTHYSLLVFGFGRIPIVAWMREQADEALRTRSRWASGSRARRLPVAGDRAAARHPQARHRDMLRESLETESAALALYRELLDLVKDGSVPLEEFARQMIAVEELHAGDVDKMLRKPGQMAAVSRP